MGSRISAADEAYLATLERPVVVHSASEIILDPVVPSLDMSRLSSGLRWDIEHSDWAWIISQERRLAALARRIRCIRRPRQGFFCANEHWYGEHGYRNQMCDWVGWGCRNPVLRTSQAYDVAYEYLYQLLPNCRHEGLCAG